ncbi:30S ribosomal protein S12 methylthiotransferase RimO [Thermoanaerobacterium thermosaccharolyticum]|uniref:Ribosomal protein uS12 methylthiotransferase RimO n=3 Tax=Thermoanaerobacterium thermosaccharolyticum TaxID=1517 RepID=D9TLP6_THETC|nr:30S ribosomal protein S12 methylthiotransferase RimO [Thermoanaerobacterium thermosaccharolyticum]TCW38631.1 SSU ribosomal protein S12P methylthiotransferase [Thermohydrogenium kirishiense]ADL68908.1 RNA modification enzyme, MiaB family [Thermoanaerobacterium thermosaccharolyticum DSM 571]AGB19001.1 SSU ribosomal protein S12P methylthiotransferase [Thermoanaerobacterium thermosaccharolyticum M0795]AST59050.1 ribosomal protein S12 methylthiotransferase [Thermoanaerobacterium thermosaccharolyt
MVNVGIISLGCAKNTVDSEKMLGIIKEKGYNIVNNENDADVLIINTCGFIESAKRESINYIIEMGKLKEKRLKSLIAAGCLSERYKEELLSNLPELDAVIGTGDFLKISEIIESTLNGKRVLEYGHADELDDANSPRMLSTPKHYGYLKIAEGCNNKCSFCIIPKLRGHYRSVKIEDLVNEAKIMAKNGVRELILIAQDTTKYGIDIYKKFMLPTLLRELSKIDEIKWIRILYAYPDSITDELIEEIRTNSKLLKYVDMPLQHSNNNVLKRMKRNTQKEKIEEIIDKLRTISGMVIRTTFIVGFPGETDTEFDDLKDFIKEKKFNKLGVFTYSREEDTEAYGMPNQVPEKIKQKRYNEIMLLQRNISLNNNKSLIGTELEIVIEGYKDGLYYGRSYIDAPDIDGVTFVKSDRKLNIGDFVKVRISKAFDYDLMGELL